MALKAYYRLDGNSNDASGNGNNGSDTNITYGQGYGAINSGAKFNGSTSKISISGVILPNTRNDYTISFMGRFANDTTAEDIINDSVSNQSLNEHYKYRLLKYNGTDNKSLGFMMYNGTLAFKAGTLSISTGKFVHIVAIYSTGKMQSFVDSKQDINESITDRYSTYGNPTRIGGISSGVSTQVNPVRDSMDEIKIDDTAWTAAKVKNEYSRIKGFF